MTSKTVRESEINPTVRESNLIKTVREDAVGGPDFRDTLFPSALQGRFSKIELTGQGSGESDCYILTGAEGTVFGKVYHRGKAPNVEVMARLGAAAADKVVRRIDYAPVKGDQRAWELLEYLPEGSLADLIAKEGPQLPEPRVRQVLVELIDALAHVHRLRVEHRDLKPGNVLIRSREPFDLVLADFGIASAVDDTMRFTSGHQTQAYGPPEAYSGAVFKERWDSWSLGMMLVEMLTGRHPLMASHADHSDELHQRRMKSVLAITNPDDLADGVQDEHWVKLCRGLLRRDPRLRWTTADAQRWLDNPADPALRVENDRPAISPSFRFRGADYYTPQELTLALRKDPQLMAELLSGPRESFEKWMADDLGLAATYRGLGAIWKSGEAPEIKLMRAMQTIDPSGPPIYSGRELTPANLGKLAEAALANDAVASGLINQLHEEDALSVASRLLPGGIGLEQIVTAWRTAVADYERASKRLTEDTSQTVKPPRATGRVLTLLLAAATPGSGAAVTVQRQAAATMTEAAQSCLWFQTLGVPSASNPAGNVLIIQTAEFAAAQVVAAETARASRNSELWNQMGMGALVGGAVAGVWWMGVASWCSPTQKICVQGGWFDHQSANLFDLLFLACAFATAVAVLLSVHQQTGRKY